MENQKNNSSLKAIILVLALLLVGSLFYIYQLTSKTTELTSQVTAVKSEKENILKELGDLKATYDAAIAENTSMSDELIAERDKIVNLMEQLKKSKGDVPGTSMGVRIYSCDQPEGIGLMASYATQLITKNIN